MTSKMTLDLDKIYGVVGIGRLGSSLIHSFGAHGGKVLPKSKEGDFAEWLAQVDVVCLSLQDDALAPFVDVHQTFDFTDKTVLCHSGVTPLSVLQPLEKRGAVIGKWHPLQSFTLREPSLVPAGTHWAYEGDVADLVEPWTQIWGGVLHHLEGNDWQAYHLAAVLSANYLPLLIRMGSSILEPLAANRQEALDWLKPLIEQSVQAGLDGNNPLPFSGPAIRGDQATLDKHAAWLATHKPDYHDLFEHASDAVATFARKVKASQNR